MVKRKRIRPVGRHARAIQARNSTVRTARRAVILAFAVGSLGAGAATASAHGGHDSAQLAGTHHGTSAHLTSTVHIAARPWMY
jgi:hypothetical protein